MNSTYTGTELELFREAKRWKTYWASEVGPFVSGNVLEVGAGIGANMQYLRTNAEEWVCIEPDPELAKSLVETSGHCSTIAGTIHAIQPRPLFDTVLYIDVLEHIDDDKGELQRAAQRLRTNGRIVVLTPAYAWLYSEFDAAIGHYRRYARGTLTTITPPGTTLTALKYLDMAGVVASLANRLLLRSSQPSLKQIRAWDRYLVPVSRRIDRWFGYRAGKTVMAVWRKNG